MSFILFAHVISGVYGLFCYACVILNTRDTPYTYGRTDHKTEVIIVDYSRVPRRNGLGCM